MVQALLPGRRRFLGTAAMTLAAARFGTVDALETNQQPSRLLMALDRATGWINSPLSSVPGVAGKVVLVQFGTYTCINWLRTLPHIRAWAQRYAAGLTVIGVHTPEFAFEKNPKNVRRAVQQLKIGFPLAIDNEYADLRTVTVGREQLIARRALVIATGSRAAIPPIPGLDAVEFWTNRQAAIPRELPASLAILGAGAIGVELGQAFARLGSKVTLIEAGPTFLGLEEPEAGAALRPHLEADGITLMIGDPCVAVEKQTADPSHPPSAVAVRLKSGGVVSADRLLVATGRGPNVEAWRSAGLAQTERGWLKVDPATLEARAGVFGAGDITGLGGFTHLAHYHGQVIARRLRGMAARADHTAVPRVTFTDPEVASVGMSEAAARAQGIDVIVANADPAETARGYIHDFHQGALKLVADRERGVLVGATLVTPRAGEIVGELVLAIKLRTPLRTLADVIHPFPAFIRVLGASLEELAATVALQSAARI